MGLNVLGNNSYLIINKSLITFFGIECAAYISELLNDCTDKNSTINVNRNKISGCLGIIKEDQYKYDKALENLSIIKRQEQNLDILTIDVFEILKLVTNLDKLETDYVNKFRNKVIDAVKHTGKTKAVVKNLKLAVVTDDTRLKDALYTWIEALVRTNQLSSKMVTNFETEITSYAKGDIAKAVEIVVLAAKGCISFARIAIKDYETIKNKVIVSNRVPRITSQRVATKNDICVDKTF